MPCFGDLLCKDAHGLHITFDHLNGRFDRKFYGSENGSIHWGKVEAWYLTATIKSNGQAYYGTNQGWLIGDAIVSWRNGFAFSCDRDPTSKYTVSRRFYAYSPGSGLPEYVFTLSRQGGECWPSASYQFTGAGGEIDFTAEYRVAADCAICVWRNPDKAVVLDTTQYRNPRNMWTSCIPCPEGQVWSSGCCCEPCVESNVPIADGIYNYLVKLNG
jgi:hypothetical protein